MVLATSSRGNPGTMNNVERDNLDGSVVETIDSLADDETMVSSHEDVTKQNQVLGASRFNRKRGKHLRFRTRTFAAECLRHLLKAVGNAPAHFDLSLAREAALNRKVTGDWLVLHVHELISLAYQISTIQLESMQPIGVEVLSAILDKFEMIEDPELPGHLLLEQYQAQLVSACRTALDASSGPILLEAGLRLATKILTSGIISGDQASVKRIYSLISRPLEDFKDLYYPSFAEWVSCKIKIRLLAAHASLKCYSYTFLKKQHGTSNEYSGLIPLLSKSSSILGKYWMLFLRDYIYICFGMHQHKTWMPFLEGIQSPFASDKLISCLEEAWPVVFQAVALDAIPATSLSGFSNAISESSYNTTSLSGYNMVALEHEEYQLVCGFALLVLFQWQHPILDEHILPASALRKFHKGSSGDDINVSTMKLHEIVLPVLQFLSTEKFFNSGFLNLNFCQDLVKMLTYFIDMDNSWHSLAVPVFLQIVQNCPEEFLSTQNFLNPVIELCAVYLLRSIKEIDTMQGQGKWNHLMTPLFSAAKALVTRLEPEKQLKSLLVFLLIGFECCKGTSESNFSAARDFICHVNCLFNNQITDSGKIEKDSMVQVKSVLGGCLFMISKLTKECTESIYTILNQMPKIPKLLQMKQAFYLELAVSYAQLAYLIVLGKDCGGSDLFFWSCLKHSVAVFQTTITDSNLQVRAIALHVLYSLAQKGSASKSSFYLFFMCELSGAIFSVLTSMLKKPVAKEKMAIVGECVRLLVLLHSLAKDSECERGLINLLLEGIVLVLSASEDDLSPEIVDVRNLSIKIVSHLAQLPSSAALFKDALLTMPVSRRQRLQVIIRESVTKNQGSTQPVSSNSPLIIKLPAQPGVGEAIHHPSDRSGKEVEEEVEVEEEEEEEEEEEDDWDAFQSFPATTAPNAGSEAESNESTSVQSVHVTTAPNKDSQSESAEDPKQLNDVKDEDCEALKSPSTASNSGPEGESPTQVSDIKNKDSEALNSPSSATNSDSEAKSPMQVHDSKNDDIKALKCPSNASNSDPEAKSSKQVNNFINEDSEALKSPSIASSSEPEAKSDLEEPSPVDNVKTNSNESLQSTPMAPTPKLNSEGGFNTAVTTPVDDFMNDSSKNYSGSAPGDSIMQIADEEPEKASNELVLSESRISAIEVPKLQGTNDSTSKNDYSSEISDINHHSQVAEASPSAKEDHPISHANITHDESNGL